MVAVTKPKTGRKNRPAPPGRVKTGDYGETVLRIMYRLRGGTRRELCELLATELTSAQEAGDFSVAEEGRNYFEYDGRGRSKLFHRMFLTLSSLERQRLVKSYSLPRAMRNGVRSGRPSLWYELPDKGSAYAGSLCGLGGTPSNRSGHYGRHGSRARDAVARKSGSDRKIAHTRTRNRMFLRLFDSAAETGGEAHIDFRELWGESHPSFPLYGGRLLDAAGNPVTGSRKYETCEPDGLVQVTFTGGFTETFMIENESSTRSEAVKRKVDRFAAAALAAHSELGAVALSGQIAALEAEVEELTEARKLAGYGSGTDTEYAEKKTLLRKLLREREAAVSSYAGFPESVRPVLFVLPKAQAAWDLAERLRSGNHDMPRLKKLQALWAGYADFRHLILFSGMDAVEAGAAFGDHAWRDLSGRKVSLRQVAQERSLLLTRPLGVGRP